MALTRSGRFACPRRFRCRHWTRERHQQIFAAPPRRTKMFPRAYSCTTHAKLDAINLPRAPIVWRGASAAVAPSPLHWLKQTACWAHNRVGEWATSRAGGSRQPRCFRRRDCFSQLGVCGLDVCDTSTCTHGVRSAGLEPQALGTLSSDDLQTALLFLQHAHFVHLEHLPPAHYLHSVQLTLLFLPFFFLPFRPYLPSPRAGTSWLERAAPHTCPACHVPSPQLHCLCVDVSPHLFRWYTLHCVPSTCGNHAACLRSPINRVHTLRNSLCTFTLRQSYIA
jgi:hypothetical protein